MARILRYRRDLPNLSPLDRQLIAWLRRTRAPVSAAEARHEGRPVRHPAVARAVAELRGFGVPTKLAFVWSTTGSGVEEDHPRTIHVHRGMLLADRAPAAVLARSARTAALDLADVARHEIGHALLFLDDAVARTAGFKALFGDVASRYRVSTAADEVERRLRRHGGFANPRYRRVISLYAAAHPHERFAEAVKVALATRGDDAAAARFVAEHRLAGVVLEQVAFAAGWLSKYKKT